MLHCCPGESSDRSGVLMGAQFVALTKDDGARGIATRSSLSRLVARTLVKQFTKVFEAESGICCGKQRMPIRT